MSSKSIKLLFLFLLLAKGILLHGYTVFPACPDFTDINATYVEAFYNRIEDPFKYQGLIPGRHTLIDSSGTDPNTGNVLQILPVGEPQVVKLGNDQVGFEAEALRYHFIVDKEKSILKVDFAVVFQDPSHPYKDQPRFRVRIMDKNGILLGDCSEYDVTSGAGLPGFQTYQDGLNAPVRWRDWTTLILDLSRMAGQEVQVEFTTFDCGQGAHYGYAYFTASCMQNQITMQGCTGTEVTASAPAGYAAYLWDNGDRTQNSTRTLTGTDMKISCLITTEMGCYYTLNGYITDSIPVDSSSIIIDSICEGDAYFENYFNLPPQYETGNFTYYNTYINSSTCEANITTTLNLYVRPRFNRLEASICIGESYTENGFNISNPPVGLYRDTLIIPRPGTCDSVVYLKLTVNSDFKPVSDIIGDTPVCVGEELIFTLGLNDTTATYTWQVPPSASIIYGQGTFTISVVFNDTVSGQILVHAENGCDSQDLIFNIKANQSYKNIIEKTLCTGEEYNENGFNLSRQDSVGKFVYINDKKTVLGCDSITVLSLTVNPTPIIDIAILRDSFICVGDSVILNAIGAEATYNISVLPKVIVGDILCTDSTIIRASSFASSGKTAQGIVFYVDNSGEHGWAVKLNDLPGTYRWSTAYVDLPGLTNYVGAPSYFLSDVDGYNNTLTIRLSGPPASYPGAYAVDFANGWYLPAYGQLKTICTHSFLIEPSFIVAGGLMIDYNKSYITSTEYSSNFYYISKYDGSYYIDDKRNFNYIREVINF